MKFTISWLKDHLETEASVEDIAYALTDLGLEVEEIENRADALKGFTIGKIKTAEKHPDADRLQVCQVETDQGMKQIICGAPNARAGITVVIAHPGTYVPGIDTTIQIGRIRGVESHGMMCSEREMQLSDEHDGIIELPSGEVGERFVDWLAAHDPAKVDPVIDIAITPNRPDGLGVEGVARDLAARGLGTLKPRVVPTITGGFPSPVGVSIDADVLEKGCPVFCGRVIRGVKNGPSPDWLQDRLRAVGLRPISILVDITNFFTIDANRPLHVFDVDKVKGDLRVHFASGGEVLTALDDKDYTFQAGMMAISDDTGVESIAGVMGGQATGCSDETTTVFVESAYWDPVTIAATGRRLKITSDARYRFERGVDPAFTPTGLDLATQMVIDLCGGEASDAVVAGRVPDVTRSYRLDTDRVSSLVGMTIEPDVQVATLKSLGFVIDGDQVTPPTWRPDVLGEADLVEEIARVASLTQLQGKPLARETTGVIRPILTREQKRNSAARRMTAALGYNECVSYSFIDQQTAGLFGGGTAETMLSNPISSEMSHMRPDLLPGLLQAAARNQARGFNDLALFEVGPSFKGGAPGEEQIEAAGILVGHTGPRDAHGERRSVDIYDVKADAEAVLAAVGAPAKVTVTRNVPSWWHPGRAGQLSLGPKNVLAAFGEIHPKILTALNVKGPVVAFTVFVEKVPFPKSKSKTRPALEISDLQAVERDFAFVVDERVEALTLINAAKGADKALIADVALFDVFSGEKAEAQMGEGKKSLAITVRLEPTNATLTDGDIESVSGKIIDKVAKATGGVLRG